MAVPKNLRNYVGVGVAVYRQGRAYKGYTSNPIPTETAECRKIRESVDSLCRDGAGPPIVCVH